METLFGEDDLAVKSNRLKYSQSAHPVFADFPILNTPEFRKVFDEWFDYRKEKRWSLPTRTIRAQLKKLSSYGHDRAIECIERTIEKGWLGLWDLPEQPAESPKIKPRFHKVEEERQVIPPEVKAEMGPVWRAVAMGKASMLPRSQT